ncbi:MAG TPA: hypothetical protein PKO15_16025 [Fibrobacteria bacterium]|nr:hypothetical protein [Fibrobacteria bacterium]HOX51806.1 hypothetical protein [Fibrobacteria bacterium]
MLSRKQMFLVGTLSTIALAWIAKTAWIASLPYRSAKVAAKIKHYSESGEISEAVKLMVSSRSSLNLADEYSCKVKMVMDGWYEGPSREQVLGDAKSRGLPEDSLLTWKLEFALEEAFSAPFHGYFQDSKARLKRMTQEAEHRRPGDSLTLLAQATTHFQYREFAQCRKLVDPAFSRWPESFRFRLLKGRCLVAQGKHDSALLVFPNLEEVFQSESIQTTSYRPMRRTSLLEDWYRTALVGARGVEFRRFAWNVLGCHGKESGEWQRNARAACQIHARIHPADSASHCLKETLDGDDPDTIPELLKLFGAPPKCPEWVDPATSSSTKESMENLMQRRTDCLFGTGDSAVDSTCEQ